MRNQPPRDPCEFCADKDAELSALRNHVQVIDASREHILAVHRLYSDAIRAVAYDGRIMREADALAVIRAGQDLSDAYVARDPSARSPRHGGA